MTFLAPSRPSQYSSVTQNDPLGETRPQVRSTTFLVVLLVVVDVVASIVAFAGGSFGPIGPVPGVVLCLVSPTLLAQPLLRRYLEPPARVAVGVVLAVLALILIGLILDLVLPLFGDTRPLSTTPLTAGVDAYNLLLLGLGGIVQRRVLPDRVQATVHSRRSAYETLALLCAGLSCLFAVAGAIRLNNGAGDSVGLLALCCVCLAVALIFGPPSRLSAANICLTLAGASAGLVLLTAMRGWFINGPDSLGEYAVYRGVATAARWSGGPGAYNSCLDITILPQLLVRVTGISSVYVWKMIFPVLSSVTTVFVFLTARLFVSQRLAALSAVAYMTFPAFVYSLAFAARQEIAFIFVGCFTLIAFTPRTRATSFLIYASLIGVVLCHYSTAYYLAATLVGAFALRLLLPAVRRLATRPLPRAEGGRPYTRGLHFLGSSPPTFLALTPRIVFSVVMSVAVWYGLINGVTAHLVQVTDSALENVTTPNSVQVRDELPFPNHGVRVKGTLSLASYAAYEQYFLPRDPVTHGYYSQSGLNAYTITSAYVNNVPQRDAGHLLAEIGISSTSLNSLLRSGIALALEALATLGCAWFYWRSRRDPTEFVYLAVANLAAVAGILLIPALTQNYGAGRGFQQALFVLGPCVAVALVRGLALLRIPANNIVAGGASMLAVISLTGLLPQVTGGYTAQLDLNNQGIFYAEYYTTTPDVLAANWLNTRRLQPVQMNEYLTDQLQLFLTVPIIDDDFPDTVRQHSWLLLGTTTVQSGADPANGQIVYHYPSQMLTWRKSLIYSSPGAQVYH